MKLLERKELFQDYFNSGESGFIEHWDFSEANLSVENRVKAVSQVASVCYGNNGLKPNFKLFDKLARESIGLPSSSFEFVPVLLNREKIEIFAELYPKYYKIIPNNDMIPDIIRYGYVLDENAIITNLRALMTDLSILTETDIPKIEEDYWLNTKEEIEIIRDNFKTFKIKTTIRDFRQFMRHRRASYQELSRRYTNGKKVPLEFRFDKDISEKFIIDSSLKNIVDLYDNIMEDGFPAQLARDILPVSLYSTAWVSFYPDGLHNFEALRTKTAAQREIREIALTMKNMLEKEEK